MDLENEVNSGIKIQKEREGIKNVFEEIMAENPPNLKKETNI